MPSPDPNANPSYPTQPPMSAGYVAPAAPPPGTPPADPYARSGAGPAGSAAQAPPAYTQPAYGPSGYAPYAAPEPPGRSHRWVWWVVGIVVVFVLLGCISTTIAAIIGGGSAGSASTLGASTIAVIHIDGTIAGTGASPSIVTPEAFRTLLRRAEKDDSVKAIVLRVDSPGGTVAASEEIATYVKLAEKPVVVSVGDVDASGAYMVSSQADRIVANPGSAVGSIGVITEIPNVEGLLTKLGIQFKVIHAGSLKDTGSPFRSLTPTETALIQGEVDEAYGQFIDIVASGRRLPRSQVESMATGWAWNAVDAKKLGLVDQIGTYQDALDAAAKLGHIKGEYNVDVYQSSDLSGLLSGLFGLTSQLSRFSASDMVDPTSLQNRTLAR